MPLLNDRELVAKLVPWLRERVDMPTTAEVRLRRPRGAGWSNDTRIAEIRDEPVAVLRMQPDGPAMFPVYDLARELRLLEVLAARGDVPVPRVIGSDLSGEVLGRPLLAMAFVAGQVPSDDKPSFAEAGWLHDAPIEVQRRFHQNMIGGTAAVHRIPVELFSQALGLEIPVSMAPILDALELLWRWDRGEHWPGCIEEAFQSLRANAPCFEQAYSLWGDARPANVIVACDGFSLRALLDWELAGLGPPELDVCWLLEKNRMRTTGAGVAPLPGFLDDEESVKHYETISGTKLEDIFWFRFFSAVKMAVLMHRYLRVAVGRGGLSADHRLLHDTVASRRVSELLAAQR